MCMRVTLNLNKKKVIAPSVCHQSSASGEEQGIRLCVGCCTLASCGNVLIVTSVIAEVDLKAEAIQIHSRPLYRVQQRLARRGTCGPHREENDLTTQPTYILTLLHHPKPNRPRPALL